MDRAKIQKEFENKFDSAIDNNNFIELQACFTSQFFKTASQSYKKSCMDNLVCSGYRNPEFAKFSLTTKDMEFNGDIHENADRPLRLAAQYNTDFAKYLLTSPDLIEKANINETNDGSSVILEAIKTNNLEFVKYLLTSPELSIKARLNIAKKSFNDPLCKAISEGHTEIAKYLLTGKDLPIKSNIKRLDYAALKHIIGKDDLTFFHHVISNKLISSKNINDNLNDWFALAIINNSPKVATYLEDFFKVKPELNSIKYNGDSLFFNIAEAAHYARIPNHYYLHYMLNETKYMPSAAEIKELEHFYVYGKDNNTQLLKLIKQYEDKLELEKALEISVTKVKVKNKNLNLL